MTYAAQADMEARFGNSELAQFDEAGRIEAALADAAAEIDGALSVLYILPLGAGPWPLLRRLQCDLARAGLYDESASDTVSERAETARKTLESIRDGEVRVLDGAGVEAPRRVAVQRSGPEPVMTRGNLAGFA